MGDMGTGYELRNKGVMCPGMTSMGLPDDVMMGASVGGRIDVITMACPGCPYPWGTGQVGQRHGQ